MTKTWRQPNGTAVLQELALRVLGAGATVVVKRSPIDTEVWRARADSEDRRRWVSVSDFSRQSAESALKAALLVIERERVTA